VNKHNCKAKFGIGQKFVFSGFPVFVAEIEEVVYTEKAVFYNLRGYGYISEYAILHNDNFQLILSVETKGE